MEEIILTSTLTILGGVIIYVIGQLVSKFLIDPIQEQKKIVSNISHTLFYYAHVFANTGVLKMEVNDEVWHKIRDLSSQLKSNYIIIPFYSIFSLSRCVIKRVNIDKAYPKMVALGNSVYSNGRGEKNQEIISEIKKYLSII